MCRKGGAYDILLKIEVSEKVHCDFYYYQVLLSVWITYKQLVQCRNTTIWLRYMLINCKSDCLVLRRIIESSRNIIGGDFKCVEYIFLPLQQGRSRFSNCKTEDRISKAKILWWQNCWFCLGPIKKSEGKF